MEFHIFQLLVKFAVEDLFLPFPRELFPLFDLKRVEGVDQDFAFSHVLTPLRYICIPVVKFRIPAALLAELDLQQSVSLELVSNGHAIAGGNEAEQFDYLSLVVSEKLNFFDAELRSPINYFVWTCFDDVLLLVKLFHSRENIFEGQLHIEKGEGVFSGSDHIIE